MYVSSDISSRRIRGPNAVFGPNKAKAGKKRSLKLKRCAEQGLYNKSLELSP
jgi:hypothetical protein